MTQVWGDVHEKWIDAWMLRRVKPVKQEEQKDDDLVQACEYCRSQAAR